MIILYVAITVFGFLPNTRGRTPLQSNVAPIFLYHSIAGVALGLPLRPRMQVAIVVNPANPKQALIRNLYV
jgi:hypothetical protein